jgi:hypothetical protein
MVSGEAVTMSGLSTMQYTIGTAIDRAREAGYTVDILVDGHWMSGMVVACDGIGVVLDNTGEEHAIARLERVSAVRVASAAPMLRPAPAPVRDEAERTRDGAVVMPGPRAAAD